jgi:hypothetical protein
MTMDAESLDAQLAGVAIADPVKAPAPAIVQVEQALNAVQTSGISVDDIVPDEQDADVSLEAPAELETPVAVKYVDPIQLRAQDGMPVVEPVLVSANTLQSVESNTPINTSVVADTPELPVAPVDLDVVRVDIDDDLAVEVRAVDGEVDVALLGADAVKPVMKGVQAELRESLKRGGYDLGQFERSEQDQAERRHRRRQHQQQERRDPRRGALL